jgi:hypothetical protein
MSEREATECARYGEVQRWSTDSEVDVECEDDGESEEPTEFGVVWERHVIKETEEAEMDPIGTDLEGQMEQPHHDVVLRDGEEWMLEARKERTESPDAIIPNEASQVPSPSLSDFEAFLDELESERHNFPKATSNASKVQKAGSKGDNTRSANDEYWENILQKEKERLENDLRFKMVPVDGMMLGASVDDDDLPIVSTSTYQF